MAQDTTTSESQPTPPAVVLDLTASSGGRRAFATRADYQAWLEEETDAWTWLLGVPTLETGTLPQEVSSDAQNVHAFVTGPLNEAKNQLQKNSGMVQPAQRIERSKRRITENETRLALRSSARFELIQQIKNTDPVVALYATAALTSAPGISFHSLLQRIGPSRLEILASNFQTDVVPRLFKAQEDLRLTDLSIQNLSSQISESRNIIANHETRHAESIQAMKLETQKLQQEMEIAAKKQLNAYETQHLTNLQNSLQAVNSELKNIENRAEETRLKKIAEFDTLISQSNIVLQDYQTKHNTELSQMREVLRKGLALEEPIRYWKQSATSHQNKSWIVFTFMLAVTLGGGWLILGHWTDSNAEAIRSFVDYWRFAPTIMLTFMYVWAVRISVRMFLSLRHLAVDAEQRANLTHSYLALLQSGQIKDTGETFKILIEAIFRPVSTGLTGGEQQPPTPHTLVQNLVDTQQ